MLILLATISWVVAAQELTIGDLVKLKGQEYSDAREQLIKRDELKEYTPKGAHEMVAWRSIQIWRTHLKLHSDLLEAEHAGPGIFSGRVTAAGLWYNIVSMDIKIDEEKFFLFSEALLFQPFNAWSKEAGEKSAYWSQLTFLYTDTKEISLRNRSAIMIEVIRLYGKPCARDVVSYLGTGHFHSGAGLDLIAEIVFGVDQPLLTDALDSVVLLLPATHRWDYEFLKNGIESRVTIIKSLTSEGAARKRADVLIALADGLRQHGLLLLDFGKYFNMPVGVELLKAFDEASQKLDQSELKKSVQQLKDAIAAYPADAKNAFVPEDRK